MEISVKEIFVIPSLMALESTRTKISISMGNLRTIFLMETLRWNILQVNHTKGLFKMVRSKDMEFTTIKTTAYIKEILITTSAKAQVNWYSPKAKFSRASFTRMNPSMDPTISKSGQYRGLWSTMISMAIVVSKVKGQTFQLTIIQAKKMVF